MSIEKNFPSVLKHEQSPYTIIINETIQQIRDVGALGIYCYLASKPESWEISTQNLMNHFDKGRDYINARLTYLRKLGALVVTDIRDSKGQFLRRETLLKRVITGVSSTTLKIHPLENPPSGKSAPINKRFKEIKEVNKEIYREPKTNCSQNDLPTEPKEPDPTPPEKPTKKELKPVEYPDTYYTPQEFVQEKTVSDDTFLEFWNLYPVKKALNRAKGAWHSNRCHLKKDEILSKLKEQLANDRQYLTGFAPNPDKYLLEERWKDEIQCAKITRPNQKRVDSPDWDKDLHLDLL